MWLSKIKFDVLCVRLMCNPSPTPQNSALSHTSPMLITHVRSNAAVKKCACWIWEGGGRQTHSVDARHGVTLDDPTTVDCSDWQRCGGLLQRKPRQTQHVYTLFITPTFGSRSSPGKFVSYPGNLFPGKFISRELTSLKQITLNDLEWPFCKATMKCMADMLFSLSTWTSY